VLALPPIEGEGVLLLLHGAARIELGSGPQRLLAPCTVRLPPGEAAALNNIGATPLTLLLLSAA
jgi:hypothetical protein